MICAAARFILKYQAGDRAFKHQLLNQEDSKPKVLKTEMKHMANILLPVTLGIRSCKPCECRAPVRLQLTGEILTLLSPTKIFPSPFTEPIRPQGSSQNVVG